MATVLRSFVSLYGVNGLRPCAYAGAQGSRGPKPPLAPCPVSPRELSGSESASTNVHLGDALDDQLGDAVAAAHLERLRAGRG